MKRHMFLCGVAVAALLLAAMGVAAAQTVQGSSCPTERQVVAGTIVENGNITVVIQSNGYCNTAKAIIDSWALAIDEIRLASQKAGVPLSSTLKLIGNPNRDPMPPEQKPSVIIRTPALQAMTVADDKK